MLANRINKAFQFGAELPFFLSQKKLSHVFGKITSEGGRSQFEMPRNLTGKVQRRDSFPISCGGFADVYMGDLRDGDVQMKVYNYVCLMW